MRVLLIESFYGGSHKQLIDLLDREVRDSTLYVQTAKKWHWRARTGALYFSQYLPSFDDHLKYIFTSSVFNLSELLGLRPDLNKTKKILYFHENQLEYPTRKNQERDFQYGYNQVLSCLVADKIIFNSHFNMTSFLTSIQKFFKTMPDYRPLNLREKIEPKCTVLYFPIEFPDLDTLNNIPCPLSFDHHTLKIAWPHRWEHDKNPDLLMRVLRKLQPKNFHVYILGQQYEGCEENQKDDLKELSCHIKHWGRLESRKEYLKVLCACDVVLSTALHEFYGVAMLEGAYCQCYPLCPNALVYPEIFPACCLYNDEDELVRRLQEFCEDPSQADVSKLQMDFSKHSWCQLKQSYLNLFNDAVL